MRKKKSTTPPPPLWMRLLILISIPVRTFREFGNVGRSSFVSPSACINGLCMTLHFPYWYELFIHICILLSSLPHHQRNHTSITSKYGYVSYSAVALIVEGWTNAPVPCMTESMRLPITLGTARDIVVVPSRSPIAPPIRATSGRASSRRRRVCPIKAFGSCKKQQR